MTTERDKERLEKARAVAEDLQKRWSVFRWLKKLGDRGRRTTARDWTRELYFDTRLDPWPPRDARDVQDRLIEELMKMHPVWSRVGPRTLRCSGRRGETTVELPMPFDIVEFFRRLASAQIDVNFPEADGPLVSELQEIARDEIDFRMREDGLIPELR